MLKTRFGLPYVIQFPFGSSGNYTFLIKDADRFTEIQTRYPGLTVNVLQYLDRPCLNINAAVLQGKRAASR